MTYELGFSLAASNGCFNSTCTMSTWVHLPFTPLRQFFFSLCPRGFVCSVVMSSCQIFMAGTAVSALREGHWANWQTYLFMYKEDLSLCPNCKEIFPNLKNQDQLSSRLHLPLLVLYDSGMCAGAFLQRDSHGSCGWALTRNHSILAFPLGYSSPCILAPTQCKAKHHSPREQYSKIPGQPVSSNTTSSYCQLAHRWWLGWNIQVSILSPVSFLNLPSLDQLSEGPFQLIARLDIIHQLKRNYLLSENNSTCIQKYMVFFSSLFVLLFHY